MRPAEILVYVCFGMLAVMVLLGKIGKPRLLWAVIFMGVVVASVLRITEGRAGVPPWIVAALALFAAVRLVARRP